MTKTLRLKVRPETNAWLCAAAIEVNQVFNFCNERASSVLANLGRWLTGYDLGYLTAGTTQYMPHIGSDTIERVCGEYALRRNKVRPAARGGDGRGGMTTCKWCGDPSCVAYPADCELTQLRALRDRLIEWNKRNNRSSIDALVARDAIVARAEELAKPSSPAG